MPHVSKSQLNEVMECPKFYEYHRFKGLRVPTSLGAVFGTAYHHTWEGFFRHKLAGGNNRPLEWCQALFRDEFEKEVKKALGDGKLVIDDDDDPGAMIDQGIALVGAYHPHAEGIDPLFVEEQYELSIPGHDWTLYGYIDLGYKGYVVDPKTRQVQVGEDGQKIWRPVIVDHKTVKSAPFDAKKEGREDDWMALNTWNQEVIGYALAYRVKFGKIEDRFEYHWGIKGKNPRVMISRVKVGDLQIRWYMDMVVEQIERIKRGYFERNLNTWKHTPKLCPAWNLCHGIPETPTTRAAINIV